MKTSQGMVQIIAALTLALLASLANAAPQLAISPLGYQVIQVQPVPGNSRAFDVTSRAGVVNLGDPATAVTARLMSSSANFVVLDGDVSFGDVLRTPPLRPALSLDTFKLRVVLPASYSRTSLLDFIRSIHRSLAWQVSCGNCGVNRPPVANAGADQTVYSTQTVTLDGSASTDPDGQALTYAWSFVSRPAGSTAAIADPANVKPTFVPDRDGSYVVRLIVKDGQLPSAPDTVEISTLNSAPVANAGQDQSALTGQAVALDGSASSDIDGDLLTYAWTVAGAPAGSRAAIADPAKVNASFTPDLPGQYVIELIVDDGTVPSTPDTMLISTTKQNGQPVANAGADQTVHVGEAAQLDGSASSDPDNDALTYRWSLNTRPTNSSAGLLGDTSPNPTLNVDRPGTYVAQLIVRDGQADSVPDTVAVSTTNSAPVAHATAPASAHWSATVQVDGSASTDVDGDALGFTWSILSRPAGSQAALSDPNAIKPTFHADAPGVYVVQLVVNDGAVNSAPVSASVSATNQVPIAQADTASTPRNTNVDVYVLANDSDADGDALSIESVTQPANGAVTIQGAAVHYVPNTDFVGTDSFSYKATDGAESASAGVTINVTAQNTAPTAVLAIAPSTVDVGGSATLSFAGSSDPDAGDQVASYSIVLRSAPAASLGGSAGGTQFTVNVPQSTASTSLTFVPDAAGSYQFELVAVDTFGASSAPASATLTATQPPPVNHAPIANAGADATANVGDVVPLNGAASSDPDGDTLSYSWVIFSGPTNGASLSATDIVNPTLTASSAGTYTVRLIVSDGALFSAPDDVAVTFNPVVSPDSDGDGLTDAEELALGTDPHNPDTDGDLLSDGAEVRTHHTNPLLTDSDGDSFWDADEILFATSPVDAASQPPSPGASGTSDSLIDAAVRDGTLSIEQGIIYKVFAAYGDARLPTEFRGARSGNVDNNALILAARALPTLSAEAQLLLEPYFIPPIYDRGPLGGGTASLVSRRPALMAGTSTAAAIGPCNYNQLYKLVGETEHANVWSYNYIDAPGLGGNPEGAAFFQLLADHTARIATLYIEEIWSKETALFGREPMSDSIISNNCAGGDGKLDIYADNSLQVNFPGRLGQTVPYLAGCQKTPVFIEIQTSSNTKQIRNALAHEFFHTLQLGSYNYASGCAEADWLGEATGNWVMDLVFPGDQVEQPYAAGYMYGEHLVPIDQAFVGNYHNTNGYSDYIFLFYLARKYNAAVIAGIWDKTESSDSIGAIASTLSGVGGLRTIWHNFALVSWNDHHANVQSDFFGYDSLDAGMKKSLEAPLSNPPTQPATRVELNGAPRHTFDLMGTATGRTIDALSFHYDYLKFTDDTVSLVVYEPAFPGDISNLKVQALVKIGGSWRTPEDWTLPGKVHSFCRDKTDERIEELVLVYSNGDPARPSLPLTFSTQPKLQVSNAGCFRWKGTSRLTVTNPLGGVEVDAATDVVYEVEEQATPFAAKFMVFKAVSGTASVERSGPLDGDASCTFTIRRNTAPVASVDSLIGMWLDNPEVPFSHRRAYGDGQTVIGGTTSIRQCPGFDQTTVGDVVSQWMHSPNEGNAISEDGRTITGTTIADLVNGNTRTIFWNLQAEKE